MIACVLTPGPCGQCELVLPVRTACSRCASTSSDAQDRGVIHIWQVTRCRPVVVATASGSGTSDEVEQCATRESQRIRSPASAHSSVGGQSTSSCSIQGGHKESLRKRPRNKEQRVLRGPPHRQEESGRNRRPRRLGCAPSPPRNAHGTSAARRALLIRAPVARAKVAPVRRAAPASCRSDRSATSRSRSASCSHQARDQPSAGVY